jgi:hypothetical protein
MKTVELIHQKSREIDEANIKLRKMCKIELNGLGQKRDVELKSNAMARLWRWILGATIVKA